MTHPLLKYLAKNQFITALLIIAVCWAIYTLRFILIGLFFSYIIMAALSTPVEFLRKKRLPKYLAVTITYVFTIILLVSLIIPIVPFFASQIYSLLVRFPTYIDESAHVLGIKADPSQINTIISSEVGTISQNALDFTQKFFGGVFSLLTIIVVSFYLLIDRERIRKNLSDLFPSEYHRHAEATINQIEEKLGAWLRGQILLSLFIGVMSWTALTILGLEFALPLALIAGILEIAPTIGPILSAIPAIIVTLTVSPTMVIIVIFIYIVIQMIENNFLVPRIMERAVGLHPLIIIIGIIIGGELMGVIGALLSVPFISMLVIIFRSFKIVPKPPSA